MPTIILCSLGLVLNSLKHGIFNMKRKILIVLFVTILVAHIAWDCYRIALEDE